MEKDCRSPGRSSHQRPMPSSLEQGAEARLGQRPMDERRGANHVKMFSVDVVAHFHIVCTQDRVVFEMVMRYGVGNVKWSFIAQQLKGRIGKQCRERWFNHLDPSIIKTPWTFEEDRIMFESQQKLGNRFSSNVFSCHVK